MGTTITLHEQDFGRVVRDVAKSTNMSESKVADVLRSALNAFAYEDPDFSPWMGWTVRVCRDPSTENLYGREPLFKWSVEMDSKEVAIGWGDTPDLAHKDAEAWLHKNGYR